MPPKKKGSKKAQDDWEADLGESIAPADDAPADANDENDDAGGGGLMAMLRKNKEKRKKKGLPDEDLVQGEDSAAAEDVAAKAPAEATIDDEFALPDKKGKGGGRGRLTPKKNDLDDETGEGGRVLTKAEKEKLKKEREKQRKKEQVCRRTLTSLSCPCPGLF